MSDADPRSKPGREVHEQDLSVERRRRADLKGQQPCVIWMTGLSGAGKSTLANLLEVRLAELGRHSYILDGDNLRFRLNRDLGFSEADRTENIRRAAEVARLMADAGLIVVVALISPLRADRQMAREILERDSFIEVFVDAPLAVTEARDPKGLYRKARAGLIKQFTGIDAPYEPPLDADLVLDTCHAEPEAGAVALLDLLVRRGVLPSR
jgi:bifunctional enzyme CysN/CysC